MAIVSLYKEVYDSLQKYPNGNRLAQEFSEGVRFDPTKPIAAQLHEINVYWMVACSRTNVDSLDIRLCFEEVHNRSEQDVQIFLREWLQNFRKHVIPFLVNNLLN